MSIKRKNFFSGLILIIAILMGANAYCQEEALFTSVAPDALIVLDLSGSMHWTPTGGTMYTNTANSCTSTSAAFYNDSGTGHTKACTIDPYGTVPKYAASAACTEPFYGTSGTGHTIDCSRLAIAKRALFAVLDDNNSNTITSADETSLGIRFGYMRFYNCSADDTGGSYSSGCNSLIKGIGTKYSSIYCNNTTSCAASSSSSSSISGESATGGTPLASALNEAKLYLDAHKALDTAASCRQKFALLITDGSDTYACSGTGAEDQTDQYKRRRATIAKAKALADAGYRTFVLGFGTSMPHWSINTLNWAAFYGKTDNPLMANSGNTSAFNPDSFASCATSTTSNHNIGGDGTHYYATSGDPGEIPLSGYAFLASNATELDNSLRLAIDMIREATYSFSLSSVSSQRTQDENNIYEASFQPENHDPFWMGHLKKYLLNGDGTVGNMVWDAGTVLEGRSAGSRSISTYKSGNLVTFSTGTITKEDLGVTTDGERDAIVGYFRGDAAYNPDLGKLGDIFRSNPVTISTPSSYFMDVRDTNNAFDQFRVAHERTSATGSRIILAGANDGQIHAFSTHDGNEAWSFIPPNFLPKLKNVAHTANPSGLSHQYFVDGPVSAADAWLGAGDGRSKSSADWKTILVFGEGRGGGSTLWSSSSSCDTGFFSTYDLAHPYYCGYYAFDVTATTNPVYRWRINPTASQAPYLGEPRSKVAIGRVKNAGNEKWVAFLGGGYNGSDCSVAGECDLRGKGFFVIDLSNGNVLWSYTRADNASMNYSIPASPAIVDVDNDGFVDTVYIGDLGGNMWRFNFCTAGDASTCQTSDWSGGFLFQATAGANRPVYNEASVAKDRNGNLWVEWGTGDKMDPTAITAQDRFYAVKDSSRSATYDLTSLQDITNGVYVDAPNRHGWYMTLAGSGEKILADSATFGGVIYFTTYTPSSGGNPCDQAGAGKLYGVAFTTGAAALGSYNQEGVPTGPLTRSMSVGMGIPTAPVISLKPVENLPAGVSPTDLYLTVSGGAGMNVNTMRVNFNPPTLSNRTNILYWKDRRLE